MLLVASPAPHALGARRRTHREPSGRLVPPSPAQSCVSVPQLPPVGGTHVARRLRQPTGWFPSASLASGGRKKRGKRAVVYPNYRLRVLPNIAPLCAVGRGCTKKAAPRGDRIAPDGSSHLPRVGQDELHAREPSDQSVTARSVTPKKARKSTFSRLAQMTSPPFRMVPTRVSALARALWRGGRPREPSDWTAPPLPER